MAESNNSLVKEIVGREHWDHVHSGRPRMRLPSPLAITTRNIYRLMDSRIEPGMRVLEVGFAPGKQLAGIAARYRAQVAGVDYSEPGIHTARELFATLGIQADLRCESIFETTFPADTFDVVYSIGVIEHFTDPRAIVAAHYRLIKKGGRCVILVPNYRGPYGRLQAKFDRPSLDIHNLEIMTEEALGALAAGLSASQVKAFRTGVLDASFITWEGRFPRPLSRAIRLAANAAGLLQPVDIGPLCPMLALEIVK